MCKKVYIIDYMKLDFNVPILEGTPPFNEHDLKMYFAVRLCEAGILDTGYAAKMVGMERLDFIQEMGYYRKTMYEIAADNTDVEKEIELVGRFARVN
jgi:predicted HTH domain antitoxin